MTPALELRLLVALIISAVLGAGTMRRSRARLDQWTTDPDVAQKLAVERLRLMASPAGLVGSAILCLGLIIAVELVVSLLHVT